MRIAIVRRFVSPSLVASMLALAMLACTFAGCGNAIQSKIVGKWKIKEAERVWDRLGDDSSEFTTLAGEVKIPEMKIHFMGDGTMQTETSMGSIDLKKEGTWKVISEDKNGCEIQCLLADQATSHQIEFVDGNTIKLDPPNMAGVNMKLEFEKAD